MNPLEMVKALGPSIVRTITTWVVGVLVTLLARAGLDWNPSPEVTLIVSTLVGSGWYILFRWLEVQASARWGWALGLPKAPTYDAPAEPDPASSTGYSATETSPVPEDVPVEIIPAPTFDPVPPPVDPDAQGD